MKGTAILFSDFLEGSKSQFVIPVYQRNYDWLLENCNQLFSDLVKISKSNTVHFFGSIVTTLGDNFGHSKLVIDGQQRITTVSLLLMAGIKAVKDGKLKVSDNSRLDEANEVFLCAKHSTSQRKIKLIPIDNDREAYDNIYNGEEEHFVKESKVTRNFWHFYQLLTTNKGIDSFDSLLNAVENLEIISIELESKDDAQLIFESLNSTGLALSEADKIRNYLLMSLDHDDQMFCYKNYWQKIEESTNFEPTMFLRDYLTIQQQAGVPAKRKILYQEWKKYMIGKNRKDELVKILTLAKYYQQITTATLKTEKLSEKMRHIKNLDTDLVNVFFIQFLKYADDNNLPEEEIFKVIDLVENYFARRIVTGLPSRALPQVFCSIHKEVLKNIDEYKNAKKELKSTYSGIMTHYLLRRDGIYQFPQDDKFIEEIKTHDAYHLPKPAQIFLFERLENSTTGEYNDVASEMQGNATIEHIMPQSLTPAWEKMLGDNYEQVREKYLHTFANLTLTGINSELSNKPFEIKRDGETIKGEKCPGYKDSKYRLTQKLVSHYEKWTEVELEERSREIVGIFLRLFPYPKTDFQPIIKSKIEISFSDETFSPTGKKLKGFRLFNQDYQEDKWANMLTTVTKIIYDKYPDPVETLIDNNRYLRSSKESENAGESFEEISQDRYILKSISNTDKMRCLEILFEKCEITKSELVFFLEEENDEVE